MSELAPGIVVGGTTSDAGKSLIATGLCRALHRRGIKVAPFKGQNMSNNSMVVPGGHEMGRAQWLQALAARVAPHADFNPILLKPGSHFHSHIIIRGVADSTVHASTWHSVRPRLAQEAFAALADVRASYDVVVAEGAGSPAEINLRADDYTNLGLCAHTGWPMMVVGDIDKGGVLSAFYGTLAIVPESDQQYIAAWLVNKFRGSPKLLAPGIDALESLTGRPCVGLVPHLAGVWVDAEDSMSADAVAARAAQASQGGLTVAVVRLPRISNTTDLDALAAEEGVRVITTTSPHEVVTADLAVIPGSRQTVDDLEWLRENGIAEAVLARAERGAPTLGICGGYQMLTERLVDEVESATTAHALGLGLLPASVTFEPDKTLVLSTGQWRGHEVGGYEIHHGRVDVDPGSDHVAFPGGCARGPVFGTLWHGAFEHDAFRRAFLAHAAELAGVVFTPGAGPGFAALRETMIDSLADALEEHARVDDIIGLIERGPSADLPTRPPGMSAR